MQRLRYFLILLLFSGSLLAQQKTKIIVQSFEATSVDQKKNISYLRKPVFRQDNATLTCDSAVFYVNENVFDAFRNVHINQADTINIYSDRLNYNGNTKIAHLTSNVRMVDRESVLTTNILDYNMGTKYGTYSTGGKIVSKDVTLTSKNGYYFSNSRDAYFRYNVVVVTPESVITSDTLRYNTLSNWAYFYGPTNIKGKDDNLYTENGAYNTSTQYAYFGKKNLYTTGSKSLKGDSLYYDGIAGYGKAVRNIVFKDTTDKMVMYGQLGYYYKIDQRTIVTKNPYIGMGTADSIKVNDKLQPDTIWMGADTMETQMVLKKTLTLISSPILKKDNELGDPEEEEPQNSEAAKTEGTVTDPKGTVSKPKGAAQEEKGLQQEEKVAEPKEKLVEKRSGKPDKERAKRKKRNGKDRPGKKEIIAARDSLLKDSVLLSKDPILVSKDSVLLSKADTLKKGIADSVTKALKTVGPVAKKKTDSLIKGKIPVGKLVKPSAKDSVPFNPQDTVRTRVIKAYHNVRVFKASMQARADSLFYTSADSTLRWYGSPILWAEGSQQTGDTIYLQLKNKKLNTLQVLQNAFMVNVNADSARFNQIKGKLITAFFKDGKLQNMFVDGNAESIYFNQNDKKIYTDMNQTVSSRIKILFKDKEISRIVTIREPEGVRTPVLELKEDVFLTGFIWKPELRPRSKKDAINGTIKAKPAATKPKQPTTSSKPGKRNVSDSSKKPGNTKLTDTTTDKSKEQDVPVKLPVNVKATDSVNLAAPLQKDSAIVRPADSLERAKPVTVPSEKQ